MLITSVIRKSFNLKCSVLVVVKMDGWYGVTWWLAVAAVVASVHDRYLWSYSKSRQWVVLWNAELSLEPLLVAEMSEFLVNHSNCMEFLVDCKSLRHVSQDGLNIYVLFDLQLMELWYSHHLQTHRPWIRITSKH